MENTQSNFEQKVVYSLRDLGYYGEFNQRDVARICQANPKMKHLFAFIKDDLDLKHNVLHDGELAEIEEAKASLSQEVGSHRPTPEQLTKQETETQIKQMLQLPDEAEQQSREINTLEQEIALLERQLEIADMQETQLRQDRDKQEEKMRQ